MQTPMILPEYESLALNEVAISALLKATTDPKTNDEKQSSSRPNPIWDLQ
jgi:hypothetical protein